VRVYAGTSGFSFTAWRGSFYPSDLPSDRMLAFYAGQLPAVELNNTFYRIPSAKTLSTWRDQVPEAFRFAMKAPQRITHRARLVGAADSVAFLYRSIAELGAKLGPLLFQLPPNLKKDLPRLSDFLALLPAGGRAAFEFRHTSWFADDVYEALRARGAALCVAESDELAVPLVATAPFGYLRLRKTAYAPPDLSAWGERIVGQPWEEAFVFFKHEEEAQGTSLARALTAIVEERPRAGA